MLKHTIEIEVDYIDTDAMGIVHHGSYVRWFERARIDWLRAQGLSYHDLEKQGLGLPLRSIEITYLGALRFPDRAQIEVWIHEIGNTHLTISYVLQKDGKPLTTANTHHVLCRKDVESSPGKILWKPARIPEEWRQNWAPPKKPKS